MGFLDKNIDSGLSGSSGKLDLVEYEYNLVKKFNDTDILNTKYKAEELGITYDRKIKKSDVYLYDGTEEIVICPEPLTFIREFDDVSDHTGKANALFLDKMTAFQRMKLDQVPRLKGTSAHGERMWMNKTLTGINLRPGNLNGDRGRFQPVKMCDDNVHGLIAGRTGSGKSVFINALILSLITEYAPWELDLYLADFKKVELSRYMNHADAANGNIPFTPHVKACAATSEIRYVISLIRYLADCMNARQEFFSRLGVTKIQEFRSGYNLVLPRVLLIVDEFQQLFTEATNREKEEIQTLLNSITKLGRATGFHLIFASQEMSGTLRGNTLANFKIRMALPCNQQISTDILGNSQAVNLERGYVLVNTESGDELENLKYQVPFVETEKKDEDDDNQKTDFYKFLDEIKLAGTLFHLSSRSSAQKFYREELQETEHSYRADLDLIRDQKNKSVSADSSLFDAVVLGKTVLYSPKANDKVSFYIEKGRNKGIMIACPDPDHAARVRKLLCENLFRSDDETYHYGMEINNLVFEKYRMDKAADDFSNQKYFSCDVDHGIECLESVYYLRMSAVKYMSMPDAGLAELKSAEETLCTLLDDCEKAAGYKEYKDRILSVEAQSADIEAEIAKLSRHSKANPVSPVIGFLEKCSREIILIPADHTKADLVSLKSYKDVISAFTVHMDTAYAAKKSIEILDAKINSLSKAAAADDRERMQNALAVKRNKILRRAVLFFADQYAGIEPEKTSLSEILERIYAASAPAIAAYKKDCEKMKDVSDRITRLSDERSRLQAELAEIKRNPNEIERAENRALQLVNAFAAYIFDAAYTAIGYKKNKPAVPDVKYTLLDHGIKWSLESDSLDKKIKAAADDVLGQYINLSRNGARSSVSFQKIVFWINGLDEIEKIPNLLVEVIRNAVNQNILVVGMITSELKDTTIRKAFDYAFVTGNIEKFYTMFNIRYTKQPLDSFVVNFGIRSKGFDIPFKMYKSNLEEIKAHNFIDELLNA